MSGLFSRGGGGNRPPQQQPPPQRGPYDRLPSNGGDRYGGQPQQDYGYSGDRGYEEKSSFRPGGGLPGGPRMGGGGPPPGSRPAPGRQQPSGQVWQLQPAKSPSNEFTFGNLYEKRSVTLRRSSSDLNIE